MDVPDKFDEPQPDKFDELRRRYGSGGGCPFNQDSLLPPNPSRVAPTLSGRASLNQSETGSKLSTDHDRNDDDAKANSDTAQAGDNKAETTGLTYTEYLRLDRVLNAQELQSTVYGNPVPDEHLFIITHQAYELWFKQIIFDLDIIRKLFDSPIVDETKMLKIVQGLERIMRIWKLLVDQIMILETMSPLEFLEFRNYLAPASGFQSLQFRLIENKLGVSAERRVKYNAQHYRNVFRKQDDVNTLYDSEVEPSLLQLVDRWLSRTPGVQTNDKQEDFWSRYVRCVAHYLADLKLEAGKLEQGDSRALAFHEFDKIEKSFATLLNESEHNEMVAKGDRRLSHKAMQGAMLIYFYRDQPRFSQPYLILTYLMDIDSLITKWRFSERIRVYQNELPVNKWMDIKIDNHVMLVQRQLGTKQGTGGSSGYMYLRSTISDRYKVFLDLFNLSTWIIPRAYVPALSQRLARKLTVCDHADEADDLMENGIESTDR